MGGSIRGATIRIITTLFFFIFFAQIATAFPCDRFGWFTSCDVVMWSNMPEDEKMQTIASMIDDVHSWNTDFEVDGLPEGTRTVDDGLVRNAWIRVMAVMPSIYEGGNVLSPGFGEVIAKSNFEIKKPYGKEGRDCDTDYDLSYNSKIVHHLNGVEIGTGEIAQFNTNDSLLDFRADLVIDIALNVDHYRWKRINGTRKCIFYRIEQRNEQTIVSGEFQAVSYQPNITYSFNVQNQYYGITQIQFNASNYSWFRLQFNDDDFYEERTTEFEPFFNLEPYYILNFKPKIHKTIQFQGVRFQNDTFQVTDLRNCKILLGDYFRTYTLPCPLQYKPLGLQVFTDKTIYEPGEIIHVTVLPKIPVLLSYGNETVLVQGSAELRAKFGEHLIVARVNGIEAVKAIYVTNSSNWNTFWGILGFLLVCFVFYKVTVRLVGGAYDLWNS